MGGTIVSMQRTGLRRLGMSAAAACLAVGLVAPVARAEGPGYGGTADTLSVAWVAADEVQEPVSMGVPRIGGGARMSAFVRVAEPSLQTDGVALVVRGLGFRGKSEIEVRVGSGLPVVARADSAGALAVALDPGAIGAAQPGVSVMAIGRNQSGTEVTLFGSVPPVADGHGPMTYVPWLAVAVAALGLLAWWRRRATT
jgi:MYXO-CTERM domain-containing protein